MQNQKVFCIIISLTLFDILDESRTSFNKIPRSAIRAIQFCHQNYCFCWTTDYLLPIKTLKLIQTKSQLNKLSRIFDIHINMKTSVYLPQSFVCSDREREFSRRVYGQWINMTPKQIKPKLINMWSLWFHNIFAAFIIKLQYSFVFKYIFYI